MNHPSTSSSSTSRRGATAAGLGGLALASMLLLCGAGNAPIENFTPQGPMQADLNAGGHNLTNAASVSATSLAATNASVGTLTAGNVAVSGALTATNFTLPFTAVTATPSTLAGYGITNAYTQAASDARYAPATGSTNYDATGAAGAAQTAAVNAAATSAASTYVPKTTTVNGHALSGNVTVNASDVGADASGLASAAQAASQPLSSNLTLWSAMAPSSYETTSALSTTLTGYETTSAASTYVPKTTTVNGHALSGNVTVSASDVGADASGLASAAQAASQPLSSNLTLWSAVAPASYETIAALNTTLAGYETTSALSTALASYLPTSAIGTTVQGYNAGTTTQGNTFNGASQLVQTDANGNVPLDPWSRVNLTSAQQAFVVLGDSRPGGATLTTPSTQDFGSIASQLGWLKNHCTTYNFAVGGALLPSNWAQGNGSPITPQTGTASWSASSNTLTLTAANGNIKTHMLVTATGIPYGTTVSSVSGTTVTLNPSIGQTYGTGGSTGSGVSVSFTGNDAYDQFVASVVPLLGGYQRVIVYVQCGVNDLGSGNFTPAQVEGNFTTLAAKLQSYGNVVPIFSTVMGLAQGGVENWSPNREFQRQGVNTWLLQGGSGIPSAQIHDIAKLITCDTATNRPVTLSSDGLHPNAAAHLLWAYDLNNFLQGNGAPSRPSEAYDWEEFWEGLMVGPTNSAVISDNLNITYNGTNAGTGTLMQGTLLNAGWGSAWVSNGNEQDAVFTPTSGSAGQAFTNGNYDPLLIQSKMLPTGVLAVGSNMNGGAGNLAGAGVIANGSAGTLTVTAAPAPGGITLGVNGTPGSTSYTYGFVGIAADGTVSPMTTLTVSNGPATLNGTNNISITVPVGSVSRYVKLGIYRVASGGTPSATGLIGNYTQTDYGTEIYTDAGNSVGAAFAGATANQGTISLNGNQATANGSTAGTVTYSEPFIGGTMKMVLVHLAGLNGSATLSFPTAFTNAPHEIDSLGYAGSLTTTGGTVTTSSATTADVLLLGY